MGWPGRAPALSVGRPSKECAPCPPATTEPDIVPIGASMTIGAAIEPIQRSDKDAAKRGERRALGVACGAHMLHDGYTDLVWVALPIWQAEFGLNYAVVGLLRTIYSGTLASLQIPAVAAAARIGSGTVLA